MSIHKEYKRITVKTLTDMKSKGEKISMLTAYDFTMAQIVDSSGVDIILVGDSASNVMAGHETTLPITLDQMIYHASSVIRAVKRSLVVVDLPFDPVTAMIFGVKLNFAHSSEPIDLKKTPISLSIATPLSSADKTTL